MAGAFDFGHISLGTSSRNLLNTDEILRLPHENAILILRGQKPLMLNKLDYTKHPLSKHLKPAPIEEREWSKSSAEVEPVYQDHTETDTSADAEPMEGYTDNTTSEPANISDDSFW